MTLDTPACQAPQRQAIVRSNTYVYNVDLGENADRTGRQKFQGSRMTQIGDVIAGMAWSKNLLSAFYAVMRGAAPSNRVAVRAMCLALGAVALLAAVSAGPRPSRSDDVDRVPVMIGGDANFDACDALGTVSGLKSAPDNTLSVRSGPGRAFDRLDGLVAGTRVWLCDRKGDWVGVVYGPADRCGVAMPSPERRAYAGPCASGWVHGRYVELTAG